MGFRGSPLVSLRRSRHGRLILGNEFKNSIWLGRCEQGQVLARALGPSGCTALAFTMMSHFRLRRLDPVSSESGCWREGRWTPLARMSCFSQSHIGSGNNISGPRGLLMESDANSYFLTWCNNVWENKNLDTPNSMQVKTSLRRSCQDTR